MALRAARRLLLCVLAVAAASPEAEWLGLMRTMADNRVPLRVRAESGARAVEMVADELERDFRVPAAAEARAAAEAMRAAPSVVEPEAVLAYPEHESVVVGTDTLYGRVNVTAPPANFVLRMLIDGKTTAYLDPSDDMVMENIELGSHFVTCDVLDARTGEVANPVPSLTVFDVVPTPSMLQELRLFPSKAERLALQPPALARSQYVRADGRKTRLVLVGSQTMDGQKVIWLELIKRLPREHYKVDYVVFNTAEEESLFLRDLRALDIAIHFAPLSMQRGEVNAQGQAVEDAEMAVDMMLEEFERLGGNVYSPFMNREVARVWQDIAETIGGLRPDVILSANARDRPDLILQRACRAAAPGARLVLDLPNLEPPVGADTDVVVAPSVFALRHPSIANLARGRPSFVINPGIETERFWKRTREPRKMDPLAPVVGFLARVSPEKSPGMLVRVAEMVTAFCPKATFVVAGDGAALGQLKEYVASKGPQGPKFEFLGMVPRARVPEVLDMFDVLVNPSLRSSETFCIANIEALAAELPLVTFASAGIGEYIRDGVTGRVAWETSAEALAREVLWVLRHPEAAQAMARRARLMVEEEMTVQRMVDQYQDVFMAPSLPVVAL